MKEYGYKSAVSTKCHHAHTDDIFNLPRYGMTSSFHVKQLEARICGLSNLLKKQLAP